MTDARNGVTTYTFNGADQVLTATTPDPDAGGPGTAQTTTMAYDNMGRVWKTTLPDTTSVTNEYYLTGLLKRRTVRAPIRWNTPTTPRAG